jgi:hypothetical protein
MKVGMRRRRRVHGTEKLFAYRAVVRSGDVALDEFSAAPEK